MPDPVPEPRRRLPWTMRLARTVRRASLPAILLAVVLLWRSYGFATIPPDMDTLPRTHPPGAACLIEKRPRSVVPGAVVFLRLADGSELLTRVESVLGDGRLVCGHDRRSRRYGAMQGEQLGPQPLAAVDGLVLVVFGR